VRAAALAYTTVLALVPMLAVVISLSAGLLKNESGKIDQWIRHGVNTVAPTLGLSASDKQQKELDRVIAYIKDSINNFRSGGLAGTAVVALIFVAISLLSSVETTLNDMWGSAPARSWATRVVHYWAAISLGPLVLLAATGITVSSHLPAVQTVLDTSVLKPVVNFGMTYFVPFLILSLAFAALYFLLPNTKVHWQAALLGGVVAGSLVQLNSQFSILYASRVAQDRSIYGGIAGVPLFLLGLYLSWMIVLLGAQVAYAFQNRRAYAKERQAEQMSQRGRERLAFRLMTCIGLRFQTGDSPPSASAMAESFGVSLRLVGQILTILCQANLVTEVAGPESAYVPARPLGQITAYKILEAMRSGSRQEMPTGPDSVQDELGRIQQAECDAASAITLQEMVARAGASVSAS
jgi:membrane protein